MRQIFARERAADQFLRLPLGDAAVDTVVDGYGRRAVAPPQTGDIADRDVFVAHAPEALLQTGFELARPAQMAGHVRAHARVRSGRRGQIKVRVKTGHTVDTVERSLSPLCQRLKLFGREIPELLSDPAGQSGRARVRGHVLPSA